MIRQEIDVAKGCALHSQPAAALVRAACEYKSHIHILDGDKIVNAKSMMGVLSLGTPQAQTLVLEAEGADEEAAAKRLYPLACALYSS